VTPSLYRFTKEQDATNAKILKKCIGGLCQGHEESREQRLKGKNLNLISKQITRQNYVIQK